MLNGKLSLHELDDVEALCANVIRRAGLELRYHEQEECLAYLVETAWELSLHYERGDFPSRFGVYLSQRLGFRLIDWQRRRYGRTVQTWSAKAQHHGGKAGRIERSLPSFTTLDDRPDVVDHSVVDHTDTGGIADVLGLQRARGSARARGIEEERGAAA